MRVEKGTNMLLIRYNNNYINECIEQHVEWERQKGYCWFGKMGKRPSKLKIDELLEKGDALIIFYNRKHMYVASLQQVQYEQPNEDYPDFYNKFIRYPSTWFRVSDFIEISNTIMSNLIVKSSRKPMDETIDKSMTSFYFVENKDDIDI
jgi:hypothetical protein